MGDQQCRIQNFFASLGLNGDAQISLLNNRHVLIKLKFEKDYIRIWVRESWYINGCALRMFKWTSEFHCSMESLSHPKSEM